ncbi:MAG: shikimate dehydrogenase [Micrococcales bacterium]
MQRKLSVLGSPIEHSKSPLIHAAAYRVLGLDWDYERNLVGKGGLRPFVDGLGEEWLGLSLTMPLKEEAAKIARTLDKAAEATGAVNTLVRIDGGWAGFNTDVFGLVQAVHQAGLADLKTVLVVGSGATATSAVAAVKQLAPNAQVQVFARNKETRDELIEFAKSLGLAAKKVGNFARSAAKADLVISTLPAGAMNDTASLLSSKKSFKPVGAILDVAYQPWPSNIASVWFDRGRPIISGLEMLLWQAVAQIRIFQHGDPTIALPNEVAVVEAMRHSLD